MALHLNYPKMTQTALKKDHVVDKPSSRDQWYRHKQALEWSCHASETQVFLGQETKPRVDSQPRCNVELLTGSNTWWQVHQGTVRQSPILPNGCKKSKIADASKMHQESTCIPILFVMFP